MSGFFVLQVFLSLISLASVVFMAYLAYRLVRAVESGVAVQEQIARALERARKD